MARFRDLKIQLREVRELHEALLAALPQLETLAERARSAPRRAAEDWIESFVYEQAAQVPVTALAGLSKRAAGALSRAGIDHCDELLDLSDEEIIEIRGIGPVAAESISNALDTLERTIGRPPLPDPVNGRPEDVEFVRAVLAGSRVGPRELKVLRNFRTELGRIDRGVARLRVGVRARLSPRARLACSLQMEESRKRLEQLEEGPLVTELESWSDDVENLFDATEHEIVARYRTNPIPVVKAIEDLIDSLLGVVDRWPNRPDLGVGQESEEWRSESSGRVEADRSEQLQQIDGLQTPEEVIAAVSAQDLAAEGLRCGLRRYQDFGARFMLRQERTLLGDEMGLGKTIQALAVVEHLVASNSQVKVLVVCPASLVVNWEREVVSKSSVSCRVLHGPTRRAEKRAWMSDGGVAVTSYETLSRLMDPIRVEFLVVDEAHFVKNDGAVRTQVVRRWASMADRVAFLTGTPLENRLDEFESLVATLEPRLSGQLVGYSGGFEARQLPKQVKELVAPVYLRRSQKEVLRELPARLFNDVVVELTTEQRRAYVQTLGDSGVMTIRQACTVGESSNKYRRMVEIVEEQQASGRRTVVYSFFRQVLADAANILDSPFVLHGGVPPGERLSLIDAFAADSKLGPLIAQIDVGGLGLNLQAASCVVLLEPQFKPSTEAQSIARVHRMGQLERVLVFRLRAADTIEDRLVEMLNQKQSLFDTYVDESVVASISPAATDPSERVTDEMITSLIAAERRRHGVVPQQAHEHPSTHSEPNA